MIVTEEMIQAFRSVLDDYDAPDVTLANWFKEALQAALDAIPGSQPYAAQRRAAAYEEAANLRTEADDLYERAERLEREHD